MLHLLHCLELRTFQQQASNFVPTIQVGHDVYRSRIILNHTTGIMCVLVVLDKGVVESDGAPVDGSHYLVRIAG